MEREEAGSSVTEQEGSVMRSPFQESPNSIKTPLTWRVREELKMTSREEPSLYHRDGFRSGTAERI